MSIESTMPSNHFIQEYRDFKGIKRTLKDNRNNQGTKMWNRERDCWKSDSLRRCGCSPLGGEDLAESLRLELFHTCRQAGNTCRFGVSCVNAGDSHRKVVTRPALGLQDLWDTASTGKLLALWDHQEETKIETQLNQELKAPFHWNAPLGPSTDKDNTVLVSKEKCLKSQAALLQNR